ncbi:MAG: polysaccharide deacetylase family protein, partial [Actinomycetota bacterium]|nr:polysaccharide deacetylase family protein [Actinomycetota bacterium]
MTDLVVLCYHAVSRDWPAALSVRPEALERQLTFLSKRGYRGVPVTEALDEQSGRAVAITFDDAYRSVLELAKPILDRLDMRASVYVPTNWPDRDGPMTWPGIAHWVGGEYEHELSCMSWDELRGLADAGWEIGSHTCSHPRLAELASEDEIAAELEGSRMACEERLGGRCRSIAYPYGSYDERVVEAAGRTGYDYGLTLPEGLRGPRPLAWPRIGIYNADATWRWRLKLSPTMRRARALRAWE